MRDAPSPLPAFPPLLAEVEAVAGRGIALEVARELGGQYVYIPRPENIGRSGISRQLSEDAVRALAAIRGSENVCIPRALEALIHHLRYDEGLTINQIVRQVGCGGSTVKRCLARLRAAGGSSRRT